jgi:acetylornithine/N-succinyldiaminopimelate aminotransferase
MTHRPDPSTQSLLQRWSATVLPTYAKPRVAIVRGSGCTVWDEDGRDYLDFLSGIAVSALGHAHSAVVEAVSRQAAVLVHASNLYASPPSIELAERLLALLGRDGRAFLCNSGAEANEAAFKLARLTGRPEVVATEGSFHGRTMGALALTGQPAKRAPFEPLPGGVRFVPYGDVEALRSGVSDSTAAVFLEPIQGEGGVVVPPAGYLAAARQVTADRGALLVLDEVQTGIGRTGAWFAHQAAGVAPDIVTLAKGLGGGLPIGACVALGEAATLATPGQHGSTFGGNPVACAAALAVLDTAARDDLPGHAKAIGAQLAAAIEALGHPLVSHVRGAGLLLGIVLMSPAAAAVEGVLRDNGVLVNAVAPDVVRLAPPLVVTDDDLDRFHAALPVALDAAYATVGKSSAS